MAPEQAAGTKGTVTTLADVHSGAILYEMLTGRPPFRGKTVLETLQQVREQEPMPPSQLNPRVNRDLETICLKCLAKDPGQRFASAEALADDLEHWLAGEPIGARPPSTALLLWLWLRRHVRATLGIIIVGIVGGLATMAWTSAVLVAHLDRATEAYQDFPVLPKPWLVLDWELIWHWDIRLAPLWKALAASMGLATALLVRPKDRSSDLIAG